MDMSLDEHDARRLAARILMEPGWQAKVTSRDGPATRPAGGYAVKAWQATDGEECAATYTSAFGWHYARRKLAASMRKVKALRLLTAYNTKHRG